MGGCCGGVLANPPPPPPPGGSVTIDAKTTVYCSPDSSMVPLSKKTKKGKEERIYEEKRKSCRIEKGIGWERSAKGLQRKRVGDVRELTSRL